MYWRMPSPFRSRAAGSLSPEVQHDLGLELGRLPGVGAHIVDLVPGVDVLLDGLPVEKDQGHVGLPSFIYHPGGVGAVHQVDAQHVISQREEAVDLLVLGVLALLGVGDGDLDALPGLGAPVVHALLHGLGHVGDVGVLPFVDGHTDAQGAVLLRGLPAARRAGGQQQGRGPQGQEPSGFHGDTPFLRSCRRRLRAGEEDLVHGVGE